MFEMIEYKLCTLKKQGKKAFSLNSKFFASFCRIQIKVSYVFQVVQRLSVTHISR